MYKRLPLIIILFVAASAIFLWYFFRSTIPSTQTPPQITTEEVPHDIVVSIDSLNNFYLNGQSVSREELSSGIDSILESSKVMNMIIEPHPMTNSDSLVQVSKIAQERDLMVSIRN